MQPILNALRSFILPEEHIRPRKSVPVERVPPEILYEIVAWFAGSRSSWDWKKERANLAKQNLLLLSRVCSHWHALIMETPALWRVVEVHARHWSSRDSVFKRLLANALARSKETPLTVILELDRADTDSLSKIVPLLVAQSHRWERLELSIDADQMWRFGGAKGKLGALHTLSIAVIRGGGFANNFFKTAPVRHFTFNSQSTSIDPHLVSWNDLHSFTFYDDGRSAFLYAMQRLCGRDTSFCFYHIGHFWADNMDGSIRLPTHRSGQPISSGISTLLVDLTAAANLEHIAIFLGALFGCLCLPHLHRLHIQRTSGFPFDWPTAAFHSLSSRSQLHLCLTELDIRSVKLAENDLLASLNALDALEDLAIADFPSPGEHVLIINTLLDKLSDSALVPRLEHLRCMTLFHFSSAAMADFVGARHTRLQRRFTLTLRGPLGTNLGAANSIARSDALAACVLRGVLLLDYEAPRQRTAGPKPVQEWSRLGGRRVGRRPSQRHDRDLYPSGNPMPDDVVWA
ncbi:F-box domain-containing protein [Mycena kentingensis (nom. inval.)]|nr:F-box domain-containing protein [Mycena kentingensis (nom. inval.)]